MSKKIGFILIGLLTLCLASTGFASDFGGVAYATRGDLDAGLVLNPEGKGDALIFPYYDVRPIDGKAQKTLFLIINETTDLGTDQVGNQGIIAKLRFHEWDKSEEVVDFDIWLSDADVWIGVITKNALTGLANIWSPDYVVYDYTSTYFIVKKLLDNAGAGFDFFTTNIASKTTSKYPPAGWTVSDMTLVGYFEVIGEEVTETKLSTTYADRVYRITDRDCPNVLMGQAFIVRELDGVAMGYNATAIANFSRNQGSLFVSPGYLTPTLASAEDGLGQLEFMISKEDIFAAYSIEPNINGAASVIITFPTKYFRYANSGTRALLASSQNPFRALFANDGEVIYISVWDRDENRIIPEKSWWSPPPTIPPLSLPYEVNICGILPGTSPTVTPSPITRNNVGIPAGTFTSGWVWVYFYDNANAITKNASPDITQRYFQYFMHRFGDYLATPPADIGYYGLPALGLQLQEFQNLTVGLGAYYGELNDVWYEVEWVNRESPEFPE